MGSEANTRTPSPSGKRSRDPEDEVYLDNLRSHKRYLSEMMASSLNGLSVGDTLPETIMESPARSESMLSLRDEMSLQYSPMSEDMDDSRYCETPMSACSSQSESRPTSPVSPYRYKPLGTFCSSPPRNSLPSNGYSVVAGPSPQPRQKGSDTEGRFPSSPSDICHSNDLRKTALLRSVQMRSQPSWSPPSDLGFNGAQETINNSEAVTRSCSYMKPSEDVQEYHIESYSSMGSSESGFLVAQESIQNPEDETRPCSYMKSVDDEPEYHVHEPEYHAEGCSSMVPLEPSFNAPQEPLQRREGGAQSCSCMGPVEEQRQYHVEEYSSMFSCEPHFAAAQEPMLNIEAEPQSCSYMKPVDDGRK